MSTSFLPTIHLEKAVLISLERKKGLLGFFPILDLFFPSTSFSAVSRQTLSSLHPHLFPVLGGVGVIQLVLLAHDDGDGGHCFKVRRERAWKGELDVVMWDTGYPAAAADKSEVGMWYVQALQGNGESEDVEDLVLL